MRPRGSYQPGKWLMLCDRCGFTYYNTELKKEWNGLYTCKECWEPRHPSDFIKSRAEDTSVPYARPDTTNLAYGTIGDANVSLICGTDERLQHASTTLTANRVVTLSQTNAKQGDQFVIHSTHGSAYTIRVRGDTLSNVYTDTFTGTPSNSITTRAADTGETYTVTAGAWMFTSSGTAARMNSYPGVSEAHTISSKFSGDYIELTFALIYVGEDTNINIELQDSSSTTQYDLQIDSTANTSLDIVFSDTDASGVYSVAANYTDTVYIKLTIDKEEGDMVLYGDTVDGSTALGTLSSARGNQATDRLNYYAIAPTSPTDSNGIHIDNATVGSKETIKTLPANIDSMAVFEFNGTTWFLKDYQVTEL